MSFWEYEKILHAQNAWNAARRALPVAQRDAETPQPLPIRTDGTGPQFVDMTP